MDAHHQNGDRNLRCNGLAIRVLRQAHGWTQAELANVTGYSLRLVRKAEAGGALAPRTIGVLAKALGSNDSPVHIDDITMTPLAIAQKFVDIINAHYININARYDDIGGDIGDDIGPAARHLLADNIVVWSAGDREVIPFAGEWVGYDGFVDYFRTFFLALIPSEEGFLRNGRFLADGKEVVYWCEAHAGVAGMSSTPSAWGCHRYVVEEGKITRFENHFDTQTGSQQLAEAQARGLLTGSG